MSSRLGTRERSTRGERRPRRLATIAGTPARTTRTTTGADGIRAGSGTGPGTGRTRTKTDEERGEAGAGAGTGGGTGRLPGR
jgi:hypothetical protein